MSLIDGWIGALERKLGCLISSSRKDLESMKMLKECFTNISKPILLYKLISRWLSSNSKIDRKKPPGEFMKESLHSLVLMLLTKLISSISPNSK
jgi:hypothetical protein